MMKGVYNGYVIWYDILRKQLNGYIMNNIAHRPLFDTDKVCSIYAKKDGIPVKYVCTSALDQEAQAMDIFYRDTPHPMFGNRYFGLYMSGDDLMIANADKIESAEFGMKEVGEYCHYSQHRHDFYTVGNVSIDGGRAYFRTIGAIHENPTKWFSVKDGEFVEDTQYPTHP